MPTLAKSLVKATGVVPVKPFTPRVMTLLLRRTQSSGSPLLMQVSKDYRLVGIHVGTVTRNSVVLGIAVGSTRFRGLFANRKPTSR